MIRVDVRKKLSFCEKSKKNVWRVSVRGGGGSGWGCQGGCERRIEVFVKIPQKNWGGGGPGVGLGGSGLM